MEIHSSPYTVKLLVSNTKSNTIITDYPLQRTEGQWKLQQKSDLVHSALIGFPIPPLYFVRYYEEREGASKPVPVRWILDGKQRTSTLRDYVNNVFKLKNYEPVNIEGVDYDISGKRFNQLDEKIRDILLSKSIPTYTIDEDKVEEEEIELLFYRMNNSKPLTVYQKAKSLMGIEFSRLMDEVANHSTIHELSNFAESQIKDNKHHAAVLQSMMLIEGFEFKNFSAKETSRYTESFKEDFNNKKEVLYKVKATLDYLNEVFNEKEKFLLKPINFPMAILLAFQASVNKVDPDVFYKWSLQFNDDIKNVKSTNYLEYTGSKSTDINSVRGRINSMQAHYNGFMEELEKVS